MSGLAEAEAQTSVFMHIPNDHHHTARRRGKGREEGAGVGEWRVCVGS